LQDEETTVKQKALPAGLQRDFVDAMILCLRRRRPYLTATLIADLLGISPAAVRRSLRRLA
jgi:hypothetical protein